MIVAICLVAAIVLGVVLGVVYWPEDEKNNASNNPPDSNTSTLPIKNGDFAVVSSDDTSYPKSALNWTKYTYEVKENSSTSDLVQIYTHSNSAMGVVDTAEDSWNNVVTDLSAENVTLTKNPGIASEDLEDTNVYMIANKASTSAAIISDSTLVSKGSSVKITVRVNVEQVTEGKGVVVIQKSTINADKDNIYAYEYAIDPANADENGWQTLEFYIFNREASNKYIRCSVGLGNIYGDKKADPITDNATGVMFVDDIQMETVTANEYRVYADTKTGTNFKIIENEDIQATTNYATLVGSNTNDVTHFTTSEAYLADTAVSPFTNRDDFIKDDGTTATGFGIYKVSNDGTKSDAVGLRLENNLTLVESGDYKDHYHLSYWVRVKQANDNKLARANVYVQEWDGTKYVDIDDASVTSITTSQTIEDDNNCGWVKHDIYIRPAKASTTISVLFTLGSKDGHATELKPQGDLYVTSPAYEIISSKDYTNATSSTLKVDLGETPVTSTVTNGNFADADSQNHPTNWTPAFAGENILYKDGKGNEEIAGITKGYAAISGSGVEKSSANRPNYTLDTANVLKLTNNAATSFGYVSADITLAGNSVHVLSVMAKAEGNAKPYFYAIDAGKDREEAIIGKVESTYSTPIDDEGLFNFVPSADLGNGWARYYIVIVTGEEAKTVRIALFNGDIKGATPAAAGSTVYYYGLDKMTIGTYALEKGEDENATLYDVNYTATNGYPEFENVVEIASDSKLAGISVSTPTAQEWEDMRTIPVEEETTEDDEVEEDTTKPDKEVDLGLLFSILSSVLLVAALLVVIVIKQFKKRQHRA